MEEDKTFDETMAAAEGPEGTNAAKEPVPSEPLEEELPPSDQEEEIEEEKKPPIPGTKIHQGIASMVARIAYFTPLSAQGVPASPTALAQGYVGFVVEALDFLDWHECLDVLSDLSKKARLWLGVGVLAAGLIIFPAPLLGALRKKKTPVEKPEKEAESDEGNSP